MKSIRWLVTMMLVAMLMLTACKKNDEGAVGDTPSSSTIREEVTQSDDAVDVSASVDESDADAEGETTSEEMEETVVETVLDTEAMVDHLGEYVLRPDDMSYSYIVPDGGEQRTATIRLIQDMGEIEAKTYVKKTGRIDGWWIQLQRANKGDFAPGEIESSFELFNDSDGARMAMSPAYYSVYHDEDRTYSRVDGGCDLGDTCEFFYSEKEEPTTELITAQYNLAFTYKNALVWVMARGLEFDMDADYILEAASLLFEKLESAPTN